MVSSWVDPESCRDTESMTDGLKAYVLSLPLRVVV